jgi:tetratricopeptide (TPR) repeat protein
MPIPGPTRAPSSASPQPFNGDIVPPDTGAAVRREEAGSPRSRHGASGTPRQDHPALAHRAPDAFAFDEETAPAPRLTVPRTAPQLSPLERSAKALLLVTLSNLATREIAPLARTSKVLHGAVAPEIGRRRVAEIVAGLDRQLEMEQRDIARTLAGKRSTAEPQHLVLDLLAHGRTEEAETEARAAIALEPHLWVNHNHLGKVLLQAGRPEAALTAARAALAIHPEDSDACHVLIRAHLLMKDPQEAQKYFRAFSGGAFDRCLTHAMLWHSLGRVRERDDKLAEAIGMASKRRFDEPSLVAEVYAWMGDAQNALLWMQEAASLRWDRQITRVALSPFTAPIWHDRSWAAVQDHARALRAANPPASPRAPQNVGHTAH